MDENKVFVHGSHSEYVKIIDKSRRAFSFSLDSTKAFTTTLKKPRNKCKHKCTSFRASIYALWIQLFKHHGSPPTSDSLQCFFFVYSFLTAFDLALMLAFVLHLFSPMDNLANIGLTFLLLFPAVAVLGPLCGLMGCLFGSASMLRIQSSMNSSSVLVNYPATIAMQVFTQDEPVYICVIVALWVNKIALSFYGAKVRQHLINPGFVKNDKKFQELADHQLKCGDRFPRSRILQATDDEEDLDDAPPASSLNAEGTVAEGEELEDLSAKEFAASLKDPSKKEEEEPALIASSAAF